MKHLLLVDCENVYNARLAMVFSKMKNWNIVLIVGKNQTNILNNEHLKQLPFVEFVHCKSTGHNCADFVAVAELARRIYVYDYISAVVLTNDKGFDGAIDYLKENNVTVNRMNIYQFLLKYDKDFDVYSSESIEKRMKQIKENKENKESVKPVAKKVVANKVKTKYTDNDINKIVQGYIKSNTVCVTRSMYPAYRYLAKTYKAETKLQRVNLDNKLRQILGSKKLATIRQILTQTGYIVDNGKYSTIVPEKKQELLNWMGSNGKETTVKNANKA